MQNRVFGRELFNLNNQNHIVLKSRSFSFENKSRNAYGLPKDVVAVNYSKKSIPRRSSYLSSSTNVTNASQNIKCAADKSNIIKDNEISIQERLQQFKNDPQIIQQYIIDNITMMRTNEQTNYSLKVENKNKINTFAVKRSKIIDWLVAVHYQLKLFPSTLYIAVSYMDTYIAKCDISEKQLEALALTCLFMAGKFQQTYRIPCIKKILHFTNLNLSREDIKSIEQKITIALDFQYIAQIPLKFIEIYTKLIQISEKNKYICYYILELSLLETNFLDFKPSILAASTVYLVHKIRKITPYWPKYLQQLTGLQETELRHCAKYLCTLLQKSQTTQAAKKIKKKYSTAQFFEASKIRLQRKSQ